ncbi:MAG: hypothetical protein KUG73_09445 [Pseudomonadales bacterium]|nr:hypothetical protein [Pseudomonadales bacterium]
MKYLMFFLLLNVASMPALSEIGAEIGAKIGAKIGLAELELNGLPVESAQSLQQNLKTIQTYFDDIKRVAKNVNQSDNQQDLTEVAANNDLPISDTNISGYDDGNGGGYRSRTSRQRSGQRDPFAITSRMFEGDPTLQDLGLDFQPDTELKIPNLKLKGVVNGVDGKIAALVDVEDVGVIVVREGDTIGLRSKDGGGLRVRKISRTGLILTAGSLGRDVIVK